MSRSVFAPCNPAGRRFALLGVSVPIPTATFAEDLGVTERSVRRRLKQLAEAARPTRRTEVAAQAPIDRIEVGRAMERFIAGRVAAFEEAAASGTDPEPERTARTVGHYAKALGLVRSYIAEIEKDRDDDAGPPARSLAELRDELRRHLERLWDESRAAEGDR